MVPSSSISLLAAVGIFVAVSFLICALFAWLGYRYEQAKREQLRQHAMRQDPQWRADLDERR